MDLTCKKLIISPTRLWAIRYRYFSTIINAIFSCYEGIISFKVVFLFLVEYPAFFELLLLVVDLPLNGMDI